MEISELRKAVLHLQAWNKLKEIVTDRFAAALRRSSDHSCVEHMDSTINELLRLRAELSFVNEMIATCESKVKEALNETGK
jgi:hypothetical protein